MDAAEAPVSEAVRFEDVSVTMGGVSILESVTARVPLGGNTAIVGPNGAGKTTLLLALLGQAPYRGRIVVESGAGGRPARIGYVPQRFDFDRGMPLTVMDFLVVGAQRLPVWLGVRRGARDRARSLLGAVRAEALADRRLGALSGGELQRVLLALALHQEPDLLVLDEPAAGVDVSGGQVFCGLLDSLRAERGFTQAMVTHDLSVVTAHATHVICLNRRVLGEGAPCEVMTGKVLTATFGIHMGMVDTHALPGGQYPCEICGRRIQHG